MSVLDDIVGELAELKQTVADLERRFYEFTGDTWHCTAELPINAGAPLQCYVLGQHTTHRFSVEA